jgi:hypothetical protein
MAGGGFRPRAGRPHGSKDQARRPRRKVGPLSPLEYALQVINDPERDRMAIAALPFTAAVGAPSCA